MKSNITTHPINYVAQQQINKIADFCSVVKPKVVIWSLVYNHAPYLKDYFEGIVMQRTDFEFVVIVHDDASTDNSTNIIREYEKKYLDIIKPIYETENQYSKDIEILEKIMFNAINATQAEYVAICEGDDYWNDPLKLQKQIDFLDNHMVYGMCYTKVKRFYQKKSIFQSEWGGPNETFDDLVINNTIPTLTSVFRKKIYNNYYQEIREQAHKWFMGDYPLWLYISIKSNIKYINEITGTYRVLLDSASHSESIHRIYNFHKCSSQIAEYFIRQYPNQVSTDTREKFFLQKHNILLPLAIALGDKNEIKEAKEYISHRRSLKFWILSLSPIIIRPLLRFKHCYIVILRTID